MGNENILGNRKYMNHEATAVTFIPSYLYYANK